MAPEALSIHARYPLCAAVETSAHAQRGGVLPVLLEPGRYRPRTLFTAARASKYPVPTSHSANPARGCAVLVMASAT
jgi:hypothetical protein